MGMAAAPALQEAGPPQRVAAAVVAAVGARCGLADIRELMTGLRPTSALLWRSAWTALCSGWSA